VTIVSIVDWAPDASAYQSPSLSVATNTYPREDGGDGPMRGPAQLATALASACKGAILCSNGLGSTEIIAGTTTKLYSSAGATTFTDRSGAATFAVPPGYDWRFTQFGTRVYATNLTDGLYSRTISAAANFAAVSGAPKARYITTVEPGFVVLGYYVEGGTIYRNGIAWCELNNGQSWPTVGTSAAIAAQSDRQSLALGDAITGITPAVGGAQGAVFTERAVYRLEYVGSPLIFNVAPVDQSRGCVAPGSLIHVGQVAYFLSEEGFLQFDGSTVTPIGFGKVDRFFWSDVDAANLLAIKATVDPYRRLVVWSYPNATGATRWLTYCYANGRWRYGADTSLAVEAFVQRIAPGVDEALTSLAVDAFGWGGYLLNEDGSYILQEDGSKILIGSNSSANFIAAFDTNHALVGFAGATLAATIETGESDAKGRRVMVSGVRPFTDAAAPTVSVGYRDNFSGPVAYTAGTLPELTGITPQRVSGRYVRVRMNFPAGDEWTYVQGADVMARGEGRR
jgi:hypothetical protein